MAMRAYPTNWPPRAAVWVDQAAGGLLVGGGLHEFVADAIITAKRDGDTLLAQIKAVREMK